MSTTRIDTPTVTIECGCKHCAEYADRESLALPLRAEVNEKMIAATGTKPAVRHRLVQLAHQPVGGASNVQAATYGPWVANV